MPKIKRVENKEKNDIIDDYLSGISVKNISVKYNRDIHTILDLLKKEQIFVPMYECWTNEEILILKEYYPTATWDEILKLLPNRKKGNIISKASSLKIKRIIKQWNNDDLYILKTGYENGLLNKDISKQLSYKFSCSEIAQKANKLNLSKRKKWTDEEIYILEQFYSKIPLDDICQKLPNRKRESIIAKAMKLNLTSFDILNNMWTEEKVKFLKENYINMSDYELSIKLNKTIDAIRGKKEREHLLKPVEKGVYNYLSEYIRKRNKQWKFDSVKSCGFKCILSGEKFDAIHHLYGMNMIIKETLNELSIEYKKEFDNYTEENLNIILNKFYEVQSHYPLGVCLSKKYHKEFHDIYGYGDNTPEQFDEYINNLNIKIA